MPEIVYIKNIMSYFIVKMIWYLSSPSNYFSNQLTYVPNAVLVLGMCHILPQLNYSQAEER